MASRIVKRYRNSTYGDTYTMEFEEQSNGTFKIYCTEHPYNPKGTGVMQCHLYGSGEVCVTSGREPRTLDKAIAIAQFFINGYSQYVRTGEFPNGSCKVNV